MVTNKISGSLPILQVEMSAGIDTEITQTQTVLDHTGDCGVQWI